MHVYQVGLYASQWSYNYAKSGDVQKWNGIFSPKSPPPATGYTLELWCGIMELMDYL